MCLSIGLGLVSLTAKLHIVGLGLIRVFSFPLAILTVTGFIISWVDGFSLLLAIDSVPKAITEIVFYVGFIWFVVLSSIVAFSSRKLLESNA